MEETILELNEVASSNDSFSSNFELKLMPLVHCLFLGRVHDKPRCLGIFTLVAFNEVVIPQLYGDLYWSDDDVGKRGNQINFNKDMQKYVSILRHY